MKTFLRFIIGFLILIALIIGIALTSPVQTAAVNFAGKKFLGNDFSVEKVSAGFSSVEITGLKLKKDGIDATVPNFLIEAGFLGIAGSHEIVIEKILAKDITLNISTAETKPEEKSTDLPETAQPSSTQIQDFFKAFTTPKIRIKEMNVAGHVSLPENKSASFELLSDKNNTTEGVSISFKLLYSDKTPDAPLASAQVNGNLTALQNTTNQWYSISHDGNIALNAGALLKQANTLITKANITYAQDLLNEINCSIAAEKSPQPILNISGKPDDKNIHIIAGFILESTELASWIDDSMIPSFNLNGQAIADVNLATFNISASTTGNINAADFAKINPLLASIAQIQAKWKSSLSFVTDQQMLHLETLSFQLTESKTAARINASTEQKISLNLKTPTQPIFTGNGDVAKIKANNITPALLGTMLPPIVSWENIDANFTIISKDGNMLANGDATIRKFFAKENEKVLSNPLNITTSLAVESDESEIRVAPLKLSVAESATNIMLVSAVAEANVAIKDFLWKNVKLNAETNLSGVTKQPALSEMLKIVNGKITLVAEVQNKDGINAQFTVKGEDINSVNKFVRLLSVTGDASVSKENAVKLNLATGLETGTGKSDILAKADFQMLTDAWKANATVTSHEIFVDDFMMLKDILLKEQPTQASTPTPQQPQQPQKSDKPAQEVPLFMKGDGSINLALDKIHYQQLDIADTKVTVKIAHGSIDLQECKTLVDKMNVQANGSLKLNKENNYVLDSKVDVKNIDPTAIMQKMGNPDALKMLNANFNANGAFTSQAHDIGELVKNMQGNFDLSSQNGVIHPFQASELTEKASGVINILGKIREASGKEKSLSQNVYDYFKEIKYDQLSLKLKRDSSLDISIPEVLLKQADMAFQGSGNIAYNATSFMDSKLSGNMKLDAKGTPGKLLEQIGLIKPDATATQNTLLSGPSFSIGGSLKNPDFSNFSKVLSDGIAAAAKVKADDNTEKSNTEETPPSKEETRKANIEKGLNALESILNRKKE